MVAKPIEWQLRVLGTQAQTAENKVKQAERKLEDLGFTKREEEGLRLKQLQRDPKTGRFSWYSTVGEPPKPPPAASVFPPSAPLP